MGVFLRGMLVGVAIAAPVGPVALLCMRYTLAHGRWYGLASGLGAALGDTFYGAVAGLGISVVANFLLSHQTPLRLLGGALLAFLGWRTWRARPQSGRTTPSLAASRRGAVGALFSTLALTLTNPVTVLAFMAIYAGLGLVGSWVLVLGVFLGSLSWWMVLVLSVTWFRARLDAHTLGWVNRLSGALITGFGLLVLLSAVLGDPLAWRG